MVTRSQAAFRLSFARLEGRRLYFWTFTAAKAMDDREFARAFHDFMRRVRRRLQEQGKSWRALRCFEPHLGDGPRNGRAHAHLVCDFRWHVTQFRACAAGTGLGRVMWVQRVRDNEFLAGYLAKYCSKDLGLVGCRRWAALSSSDLKGWHCKRADVVADWPEAQEMRNLYARFRGERGCAVKVAALIAERRGIEAAGIWSDPFPYNWERHAELVAQLRTKQFEGRRLIQSRLPFQRCRAVPVVCK